MRRSDPLSPRLPLAALAAAAALLAGCAGGPGTDPSTGPDATTSTEATTSAEPEPTTTEPAPQESTSSVDAGGPDAPDGGEPDFPTGTGATAEQTGEPQGEADLVLLDVRVGEHEGFDRVVLEFTGTGTPGWRVGYVDEVIEQGRGEVVDLDGDAYLSIEASGTTYPLEGEDQWTGPRLLDPDTSEVVEEVYVDGTYEGLTVVVAGVDGPGSAGAPFRVLTLGDPARLVVDIADEPGDD